MSGNIALLLDGIILVFLAVTIFYAARLSIFLKVFRQERSSMLSLIKDLSTTIDKAESSIATMKKNASETEEYVNGVMTEAKFLADELGFMTQSGDKLAHRLEKIADRNKELVDLIERSGGIGNHQALSATQPEIEEQEDEDPFEIFDFDIEDDLDLDDETDFHALEDGAYRAEIEDAPKGNSGFNIFDKEFSKKGPAKPQDNKFQSQAEQDLYEALQRRRHIQEA